MDFWKRAQELNQDTVDNRRYFHTHAEVGLNLPKALQYIDEKLRQYGITPRRCGHGITATIGSGGRVLLLRADMDALPMAEQSGLPFACPTGKEAHTCGHDFHAAMLLTAARMLKEQEQELKGTVKLMFQPAEETFEGGKDMITAGILENPRVDAALSFHVGPGGTPGGYFYNDRGTMMNSCDGFRITVEGKGAHGAYPHMSVDPINIAVHIHTALQELIARESDPADRATLTVGRFAAGTAFNIIPDTAVLEGSIRTNSKKGRTLLTSRMKEIAQQTAQTFRGQARVEMLSQVPPLICDPVFIREILGYMEQIPAPNRMALPGIESSGSDDFAEVTDRVPGAYLFLAAGFPDRAPGQSHSPTVVFNEEVLPFGAAAFAHCASRWLSDHPLQET